MSPLNQLLLCLVFCLVTIMITAIIAHFYGNTQTKKVDNMWRWYNAVGWKIAVYGSDAEFARVLPTCKKACRLQMIRARERRQEIQALFQK
jgi:hypothetical protein